VQTVQIEQWCSASVTSIISLLEDRRSRTLVRSCHIHRVLATLATQIFGQCLISGQIRLCGLLEANVSEPHVVPRVFSCGGIL
jgi:hypothetical protein